MLFEDLCTRNVEAKRDYIYYLAIGYTRLKNYQLAQKYVKAFLEIEANNQQVQLLDVSFLFPAFSIHPELTFCINIVGLPKKTAGQRNYEGSCRSWRSSSCSGWTIRPRFCPSKEVNT